MKLVKTNKKKRIGMRKQNHDHVIYIFEWATYIRAMLTIRAALFLLVGLVLAGCSGANALTVGSDPDAGPNGSYAGSTLNSPVTDQNPHPGGDRSYPASVDDQGVQPPPPDKSDGR